jgi:nitrogen regulatory protein PII
MNYQLIVCIVPNNCGDLITTTAVSAGAGGGTILMGKGTAASNILQLLGLGDTSKEITFTIVEEALLQNVRSAILAATDDKKSHFGVMFNLDIFQFMRAGGTPEKSESKREEKIMNEENGMMSGENNYQMINIIVNKGYAEDAMAAARKAGAGGGTIINARGTAKEGDAKFFGMDIVPEKDMLMIVTPSDKKDAIVAAIKELPCFSKAGSGIIFCNEASDFTFLGKK